MKETPEYSGSFAANSKALTERLPVKDLDISPLREDFARCDIKEGFDWPAIMRQAEERSRIIPGQTIFLMVFRSQRRPEADVDRLIQFDEAAHLEASGADGYITYFKGVADEQRYNMSFCLWRDQLTARSASDGTEHQKAMALAAEMYADTVPERYFLQAQPDGSVLFQVA